MKRINPLFIVFSTLMTFEVLELKCQNLNTSDFKISALNQTWVRYAQNNDGSLLMGEPSQQSMDVGLRRTRFYLYGNITPKVFTYFQFGQNNFNSRYNSQNGNRKIAAFIHDAWAEYQVNNNRALILGGGLTIANGLSRFSQPSIASIATLDVPVFAQATVDQTDQFSRKLSVYARGQINKLDYRLVLSDPFPPTSAGVSISPISEASQFSTVGHRLQSQFLLSWNIFEMENHQTPYMTGTYLGKKKIWNVSVGSVFQPKAMYRLSPSSSDTIFENLFLFNVETYLEIPLKNHSMIHAYLGYFNTDYGKNYLRMNGLMNTSTGSSNIGLSKNVGAQYGNAVPMFGTGTQFYAEFAYLLPCQRDKPFWMPYITFLNSNFDVLENLGLNEYHLGLNYFIDSHRAKVTIDWGNRNAIQIFNNGSVNDLGRKNTIILQYQISI